MNENPNRTRNEVEETEYDEERYVFHVTVPNLQEIAINRVVLAIWNGYISRMQSQEFGLKLNQECKADTRFVIAYMKDCNKLIEALRVPRLIEQKLKSELSFVCNEIRNCMRYFVDKPFSPDLEQYYIYRFNFNCCAWGQDGRIDYRKTALNMLSILELSDVQKFIFILYGK